MSPAAEVKTWAWQGQVSQQLVEDDPALVEGWARARLIRSVPPGYVSVSPYTVQLVPPDPGAPRHRVPRTWWQRLLRLPERIVPAPYLVRATVRIAPLPAPPNPGRKTG